MKKLGLHPSFVGKDVECPEAEKRKFITLVIPAHDPVLRGTQKLFFESLNNNTYDEFTNEVTFEEHNLVLNVSALDQDEVITLQAPRLLFNKDKGIYTAIQYLGRNKIWRLYPQGILGGSGDPPRLLKSIEQGFSIEFRVKKEELYRQDFQIPAPSKLCPTVFGSSQLPVEWRVWPDWFAWPDWLAWPRMGQR
ncbi:hypothetical protein BFJ63_vAg15222 [Fusarium oxysporum f. sp. narcissi]|uniref:Uncharacterized protein n=1 Tax=Fusarium oxysporum f. sp. narcissi TaxID=451672 RepID=A0A4Q2V465_FUSOX|nr:hypothetical protein BFJ63_vAg15222 [Fusarium oxysporum f. sp. narcissi]